MVKGTFLAWPWVRAWAERVVVRRLSRRVLEGEDVWVDADVGGDGDRLKGGGEGAEDGDSLRGGREAGDDTSCSAGGGDCSTVGRSERCREREGLLCGHFVV